MSAVICVFDIESMTGQVNKSEYLESSELDIRAVDDVGRGITVSFNSREPLVVEALKKISAVLDELKEKQSGDKNHDSGAIQKDGDIPF